MPTCVSESDPNGLDQGMKRLYGAPPDLREEKGQDRGRVWTRVTVADHDHDDDDAHPVPNATTSTTFRSPSVTLAMTSDPNLGIFPLSSRADSTLRATSAVIPWPLGGTYGVVVLGGGHCSLLNSPVPFPPTSYSL